MAIFCGTVSAIVALAALLTGGIAHLTKPATLPAALRAHRVLPRGLAPPVAVTVTIGELALGLLGTQALLRGRATELIVILGLAAVLFTGYAAYSWYVVTTGGSGPCGCSRSDVPMDGWVATRAGAFAGCALIAASLAAATATTATDATMLAVILPAAATVTLLLWQLPAAMRRPVDGGVQQWTS